MQGEGHKQGGGQKDKYTATVWYTVLKTIKNELLHCEQAAMKGYMAEEI